MKRHLPILLLLCLFSFSTFSQDKNELKPVNRAVLAGVGKAFLTDTYLSPLKYSGITLSLMTDRIQAMPFFDNKLLLQHQFQIQVAITKNPTASASEYYGNVAYSGLGFYPLTETSKFRLFAGGGWDAQLGGIYNMRNSNNPGSLKVSTNLNAATMALYNWRKFTFRWQMSSPFLGMFFSPEYGHSYYEIFMLGNNKGTVHLGSFHNQLALRNYFTVDYPIKNITLRAAYLGNYYRTHVNELITKTVSHQFMLGFALESIGIAGDKVRDNASWLKSVYY